MLPTLSSFDTQKVARPHVTPSVSTLSDPFSGGDIHFTEHCPLLPAPVLAKGDTVFGPARGNSLVVAKVCLY